jgi:4'-phosphopantetheinyl transferase
MQLRWLIQHGPDVPEGDEWLSAAERDVLAPLWAPKRRRDWRLGRWTAKRALIRAGVLGPAPIDDAHAWARLSVRADEAGVPCVFEDGRKSPWLVSISHTGEHGMAVVALEPAAIGCDVETIGRHAEEFVVDCFTDAERALAGEASEEARSRTVTTIWSAKESALKALGLGLRLDTRQVEVTLPSCAPIADAWRPLVVHAASTQFHGWWRIDGDLAMTLLGDPPPVGLIAL